MGTRSIKGYIKWLNFPTWLSLASFAPSMSAIAFDRHHCPIVSVCLSYTANVMCGASVGWSSINFLRWRKRHKAFMAKLELVKKDPMKFERYILDESGNPKVEPDLFKWAHWYECAENRQVAYTSKDDFRVSTVFMGLDFNFHEDGPPILWESVIFAQPSHDGHELHREQDRCSGTREQAEAMHLRMCAKVWPGVEIEL